MRLLLSVVTAGLIAGCGDPREVFVGKWDVTSYETTNVINGQTNREGGPVTDGRGMLLITRGNEPGLIVAALSGKEFFRADVHNAESFDVRFSTVRTSTSSCEYVTAWTSGTGRYRNDLLTVDLAGELDAFCTTGNLSGTGTSTIRATKQPNQ